MHSLFHDVVVGLLLAAFVAGVALVLSPGDAVVAAVGAVIIGASASGAGSHA